MGRLIAGLDFESTGVDPEKDRIVEVAIVFMDLESGEEQGRFERRINPGIHIPAKAVAIHGISDADVMGAPSFAEIAPGFVKLLARVDLLIGHNIERFDAPLLVHELVRAGVSPPHFPPVFDTMLHGRGCTDDGKIPRLGELCFALDVPYDLGRAHQATYDVLVNLQAFRRGWQLGVFTVPELEEVG
jgi:DNA polymerase-3 subunit epsilon